MRIRIAEVGMNNSFTPAGYIDNEDDPETQKRAVVDRPVIYPVTEKRKTPRKIKINIFPKGSSSCV